MNAGFGGWSRMGFAYRHQAALTGTYQVFAMTRDGTNSPRSSLIPTWALLRRLLCFLDTIAGGASSVTFYLARDLAGDLPLTLPKTVNIAPGLTTATDGSILDDMEHDYINPLVSGVDVEGTIYLAIKLNAGTANANLFLHWRA